MKIGVSLKINVSMIEKARLFPGQKGKYLDATVFIDVNDLDQYGNSGMITQDVSKEEKAQNVKGPILGNCKVFWNDSATGPATQQYNQAPQQQAPQQPGTFAQVNPAGGFMSQQAHQNNGLNTIISSTQQAPKVNPQEPVMDFDDDIPFN